MWIKKHKNPFSPNPWKTANMEARQRLQMRLDKIALEGLRPVHIIIQPDNLATPLILSSPHSGRNYPPSFLAQSALTLQQLRQSEDCYVDRLIEPLGDFGIPIMAALFPRIYLDPNRSPDEWPPETLTKRFDQPSPITPKARAGLGVVPLRIGQDLDIYPHPISAALVQGRLDMLYHPYHQALQGLLTNAKRKFGHTLLLDCHSMPGRDAQGEPRADIVLGNCYGDSCEATTIEVIENAFTSLGYTVMRNHPYAGGYITTHYGRPENGVEAVQIEINKDLYLNSDTLEPHAGMGKLTANIKTAILQIKDYLDTPTSLAAE